MQKAVSDVLPRFPCFAVRMKSGFFWNYLEQNPKEAPKIQPDVKNPSRRVKFSENDGFLFRIFYYNNRISVEFFHALTDGYGMTCFVMTLVARYLTLCGENIPVGGFILDINEKPSHEELLDAFAHINTFSDTVSIEEDNKKTTTKKTKPIKNTTGVYHFIGTKLPMHHVDITTGYLSVKELKKISRRYGVTITEFLSAVSLYALYMQQEAELLNCHEKGKSISQKPVGIQIPMNGRFKLPNKTLRNFSLFTCASVEPKSAPRGLVFEDVLNSVSRDLRKAATAKNFRAMVLKNLAFEKNPLIRVTPLFIKSAIIKAGYNYTAENDTSVLVTNLGRIDIPKKMEKYIDRVVFMPSPGRICGARAAVCSFADTLAFTFMNIYEEKDIERRIFGELEKMGLHIEIETNYSYSTAPVKYPDIDKKYKSLSNTNPYSDILMIPNKRNTERFTKLFHLVFTVLILRKNPLSLHWLQRYFHY